MGVEHHVSSPGYISLGDSVQRERKFGWLCHVLLGFLAQVALQGVVVLALVKYLHDSAVLYELVEDTVEGLSISQPSNPLAQFLFSNKGSLLGTSRSFLTQVILVSMVTVMIVVWSLLLLLSYEVASTFEKRRNVAEKSPQQKKARKFIRNAAHFMLGLTAGTVISTTLLLIPFFLLPNKKPESVLNFMFRFYGVRSNPLAEILKGIVRETFRDNILFERYTAKMEACLLGVFSTSIVLFCVILIFLIISTLHEAGVCRMRKESPSETPESPISLPLEGLTLQGFPVQSSVLLE